MRTSRKNNRIKTKRKKILILFILVIIISIVGITLLPGSLKWNILNVNAETIEKTNENSTEAKAEVETEAEADKDVEKEVLLNNSGYLELKNDPNADDVSVVLPETMDKWNFYSKDKKKIVYLTFDDGPSTVVTSKILDVLDANGVKGTFFTLGSAIESNIKAPEILKRMAKGGHAIANHGYSHKYSTLYPGGVIDVKVFMNDMDKNLQLLKSILGQDFNTRLIRMPGGYGTWYGVTPLNVALKEKGYYQTDWNCINGDAEGKHKNPKEQLESLKKTMLNYDILIVLMHDTNEKENTVQFLQSGIDYLKLQGFQFKTLK